jgi:3-methyladenine DNA glycosylase AlkD
MTKKLDSHLAEVSKRTEALVGHSVAPRMKGETIHRLRIPVPMVRRVVKEGYAFLSESPDKNLEIWDYIWHRSAYYEVMSQALYFYQHHNLSRMETRTILNWIERCTCWEHSDDLSKIYATVVEANPSWIVPTLKKWNRSDSAWKRRQSMVSLIEYASKRKNVLPFPDLIAFIEPLLDDDDYYVQKGLGWTLREIGNAYPLEIAQFMERHAARLAPQAWTGATKNLGKRDKARLRAIRVSRPR